MNGYRPEVDGLRGLAVLAVLVFHINPILLPGGFVGVDIFFVISGYLITALILPEIKNKTFSYKDFYRRRIARLFPALVVTFALAIVYGIIFYTPSRLDIFGRELFFSSLGLANIYFSNGFDYFASNIESQPFLHLWSLGVEEQFYFVWPTLLILLALSKKPLIQYGTLFLIFASLILSIRSISSDPFAAYFMPQYRAYELLIGAMLSILTLHSPGLLNQWRSTTGTPGLFAHGMSLVALALMLAPMFYLNDVSAFPGLNALVPCAGAVLFLAVENKTIGSRLISHRFIVAVGLISYPLYLFHLPIISGLYGLGMGDNLWLLGLLVTILAFPLAYLVFQYMEKPIRRTIRHGTAKQSNIVVTILVALIVLMGTFGILFAKSQGWPARLALGNGFANTLLIDSQRSFFDEFSSGLQIGSNTENKVLLIGDSLMQDYSLPIARALKLNPSENIDLATLGGCSLLIGVKMVNDRAPVRCKALKEKLYAIDYKWDTVFITHDWRGYTYGNEWTDKEKFEYLNSFIEKTIEYFTPRSNRIVIIGSHPRVTGTERLQPNPVITARGYADRLDKLVINNEDNIIQEDKWFEQWGKRDNVTILYPIKIWKKNDWILSDGKRAFFHDNVHHTRASDPFVTDGIVRSLAEARE